MAPRASQHFKSNRNPCEFDEALSHSNTTREYLEGKKLKVSNATTAAPTLQQRPQRRVSTIPLCIALTLVHSPLHMYAARSQDTYTPNILHKYWPLWLSSLLFRDAQAKSLTWRRKWYFTYTIFQNNTNNVFNTVGWCLEPRWFTFYSVSSRSAREIPYALRTVSREFLKTSLASSLLKVKKQVVSNTHTV